MFSISQFHLVAFIILITTLHLPQQIVAQSAVDSSVKVLLVTAHPDDESGCAATIYKITHDLKGTVDLAVITNGEAGFKYSSLAEDIYGVELTEEKIGREFLPSIRKKELMAGGRWIGIRNYFFFDQMDTHYTLDADTVLTQVWDVAFVQKRLATLIEKEKYDYIFCLLPVPETHGHHKAASIIALRVVKSLPVKSRPVVLGVNISVKGDTSQKKKFFELTNYPETQIDTTVAPLTFDRTTPFGFKKALNYKAVVNWLVAEHKSQGAMQNAVGRGDVEEFYFFALNQKSAYSVAKLLFEEIAKVKFKTKSY